MPPPPPRPSWVVSSHAYIDQCSVGYSTTLCRSPELSIFSALSLQHSPARSTHLSTLDSQLCFLNSGSSPTSGWILPSVHWIGNSQDIKRGQCVARLIHFLFSNDHCSSLLSSNILKNTVSNILSAFICFRPLLFHLGWNQKFYPFIPNLSIVSCFRFFCK